MSEKYLHINGQKSTGFVVQKGFAGTVEVTQVLQDLTQKAHLLVSSPFVAPSWNIGVKGGFVHHQSVEQNSGREIASDLDCRPISREQAAMASSSVAEPPHITNKAAVLYGIEDLVRCDPSLARCK